MPMDAAQFLRHAYQTQQADVLQRLDRYDASAQASAASTGKLNGMTFVVEENPLADLTDAMEELTFQFEETASKKVAERKLGTERHSRTNFLKAIERWQGVFPDMPGREFLEQLLRRLRAGQNGGRMLSLSGLFRQLSEGSSDPSHQFAMLDALEQALEAGDTEARALIEEARTSLMETSGEAVRAGINLAEEITLRATTPEQMQELRDMYRSEILGFSTPQDCFRAILSSRGAGNLQSSLSFLIAGCGADLRSAEPSKDAEALRRIMLDLQCVEVLQTVLERMTGLSERMMTQFSERCLLNGEALTGKMVSFTEHPFVSPGDIGMFISSDCGIAGLLARMDFCRELTWVFRQFSSRMFSKESERLQLLDATQEHLDGLVSLLEEAEEEETSGQDEGRGGRR